MTATGNNPWIAAYGRSNSIQHLQTRPFGGPLQGSSTNPSNDIRPPSTLHLIKESARLILGIQTPARALRMLPQEGQ